MNGLMFQNNSFGIGATGIGLTGALNYFYGSAGVTAIWAVSAAGSLMIQPSNIVGGGSLIPQFFSGMSVIATGNSGCGINFKPPLTTSVYQIQAQVNCYHSGGTLMTLCLFDGSGTFGQGTADGFLGESKTVLLSTLYQSGSTFATNLNVIMANVGTGGTCVIGDQRGRNVIPSIQWYVVQIA